MLSKSKFGSIPIIVFPPHSATQAHKGHSHDDDTHGNEKKCHKHEKSGIVIFPPPIPSFTPFPKSLPAPLPLPLLPPLLLPLPPPLLSFLLRLTHIKLFMDF